MVGLADSFELAQHLNYLISAVASSCHFSEDLLNIYPLLELGHGG